MSHSYTSNEYLVRGDTVLSTNWFSSVVNTTVSLTSQSAHCFYLGPSPSASLTGCGVAMYMSVTGTNVTWAEVGIWKGFYPESLTAGVPATAAAPFAQAEMFPSSLSRMGTVSIVSGTTGFKAFDCSFNGSTCAIGEELWVAVGVSASVSPQMWATSPEFLQSGMYLTVALTNQRLSDMTNPATSFAYGATATYVPRITVKLNG